MDDGPHKALFDCEVLGLIAAGLGDARSLSSCLLVCSQWKTILSYDGIWKALYISIHGSEPDASEKCSR